MKAKGVEKILVTGGAGFIGSHTVDLLTEKGYEVTILDNLEEQVHRHKLPDYINDKAVLVQGDIRDKKLLNPLVKNVDAIIHLASAVGVGQSMYQIEKYVDHNTRGTATLLDILVNDENNLKKLIVASSMSIYGEGKYWCEKCMEVRYPPVRSEKQLINKIWNLPCSECKEPLIPLPTDENKPLMPTSIYAMSKHHQEEMCLLIGKTYGIPTVALRYFNVYGPRQSLSNPYTGACAIFLSRILSGNPPYVFEDGNQTRDFVHVKDVAKANLLALERTSANFHAINIGTGKPTSIKQMAEMLIETCGMEVKPCIVQKYRKGDVRHCYADITKAKDLLDYHPQQELKEGLKELADWAKAHKWNVMDLFERALKELEERGLT